LHFDEIVFLVKDFALVDGFVAVVVFGVRISDLGVFLVANVVHQFHEIGSGRAILFLLALLLKVVINWDGVAQIVVSKGS